MKRSQSRQRSSKEVFIPKRRHTAYSRASRGICRRYKVRREPLAVQLRQRRTHDGHYNLTFLTTMSLKRS
jgi:hypothetical protein